MARNAALDGAIDWFGSKAALVAAMPAPNFPNGTQANTTDQGLQYWNATTQSWLSITQTNDYGPSPSVLIRWKPVSTATAITFTAVLAAAATTATLSSPATWGGVTGLYIMTLSTGQVVLAYLTTSAATCTFYAYPSVNTAGTYGPAFAVKAATASATVAGLAPLLGVANYYSTSAAIATTTAVLAATVPDVPRNVIGAWTATAIATVVGTDYYGNVQTEVSASGTSLATKKAFASIVSITMNANVTAATFGTGNVLGLPVHCNSGDIFDTRFADAADAGTFVAADLTLPATSSTGDVRGTYAPAGTLNGSKVLSAILKPSDPATPFGMLGVTPA